MSLGIKYHCVQYDALTAEIDFSKSLDYSEFNKLFIHLETHIHTNNNTIMPPQPCLPIR